MDFQFSIVVAIYNTEIYLEDCINSVINQSLDFKDNVQLILVDDGSLDNSKEIALKYKKLFPDNIIVLSKKHSGPSSTRNLGLKYATGKYVNFLDSDDELSNNTLEVVLNYFNSKNINIIAIPIQYIGIKNKRHKLNNKFLKTKIIDVYREYQYPQLSIASCFIKRSSLGNLTFDEDVKLGEDSILINKLLINEGKYAVLNNTEYLYRKRSDESSLLNSLPQTKEFFLDKINNYYKSLIKYCIDKKGYVPEFIQYVLIYDLKGYYKTPSSNLLSKNEFIAFRCELKNLLSYIDDELILNHLFVENSFKNFLIYLKYDDFHVEVEDNKVFLKSKGHTIEALHEKEIVVDVVELIKDKLNFSLVFYTTCDYKYLRIEAIKINSDGSKESYWGKFYDYPNTSRYPVESIGLCWNYNYSVDFSIPVDENSSKIYFKLIYDENHMHCEMHNHIKFQNRDVGLSKVSNYFIKNNKMLIYDKKDESFNLREYSFLKALILEIISILKMIKDHNYLSVSGIVFHLIYLFLYPFMKNKRIWLFQDRLDSCDDNAMHLFRYAIKQDDDIEKYYVIKKDCDDFLKMKKIDMNIIPLSSFKHKFLYLFSEKIISSHVNHLWLNPFLDPKHPYFTGIASIEKCFLQHGVIKDDLSDWLKKHYQNFHLFLTSSDFERDSIINGNYNYSPSVVQALGLPRHDNLKFGVSGKKILFAPTWRKYLKTENAFLKSSYFARLNSFLNNEELLEILKNNGFKIIFKPHYDLLPFIDLFTINEDLIEINTTDSYQNLFSNSALLITDYSSVFFDFSFLKKPVIYYHSNDYHYIKGYFDYETMGFGDIVEHEDELIKKIAYYIENNCEMEEKYKKRVDIFFKFHDQKNSKRVYDWLVEN